MRQGQVDEGVRERAHSFRDQFGGQPTGEDYRGIPMYAAPGLHALAAQRLAQALPAQGAPRVLELGAGGGAMSLRLSDMGYAVEASDLFEERFAPRERLPFHVLDLNRPFAAPMAGRFDAVVALELIEHLENPHHFLRECAALLRPGGVLVLSTPNLANPVSQAQFLRDGSFQWFNDNDYREQGHIMPLAPFVLRRCWTEAGFAQDWEGSVADPARWLRGRRLRGMRWLSRLLGWASTTPRDLRGEVYLALLRKPA